MKIDVLDSDLFVILQSYLTLYDSNTNLVGSCEPGDDVPEANDNDVFFPTASGEMTGWLDKDGNNIIIPSRNQSYFIRKKGNAFIREKIKPSFIPSRTFSNWFNGDLATIGNENRVVSIFRAIKDIWFSYDTKPSWWDSRNPRVRSVTTVAFGTYTVAIFFGQDQEPAETDYVVAFNPSDFSNQSGFSISEKEFTIEGDSFKIHIGIDLSVLNAEGSDTENVVMSTNDGNDYLLFIEKKLDSFLTQFNSNDGLIEANRLAILDNENLISEKADQSQTILLNKTRTNNLFNRNDLHLNGYVDDSETLIESDTYGSTKAIPVTPGQNYTKYLDNSPDRWFVTRIRIIDDSGLIVSTTESSVTVPIGATNPRAYLSFMQDQDLYPIFDTAMFMQTNLFNENYSPYYLIDISDQDVLAFLKTIEPEYAQESGDSDTKAMSQKATGEAIVAAVENIGESVIRKTTVRTNNLFDKTAIYDIGFIGDNEVLSAHGTYSGTEAIAVTAGKTYGRYRNEQLDTWYNTTIRLFDDSGLLSKTSSSTITIPANAVNPRLYISFYKDQGIYPILESAMVMNTDLFDGVYHPFELVSITDEALDEFVNEKTANASISLEQSTGTAPDKAMSQAAITNAISQAVSSIPSTSLASTTGSSTTQGMTQQAITNALAEIEASAGGTPQYRFAERPTGGYENFTVDVDVSVANNSGVTNAVQDARSIAQDRCVLSLPVNYSRAGNPVRLIICGHGTGWLCTASTTGPWAGMNTGMLTSSGYAVLGLNGTPGHLDGLSDGHNGVPEVYRAIMAAYKYVISKYNIRRDGVFTAGLSMGGLMTMQMACFTNIPIIAQVVYSADPELWKAQYTLKPSVRQRMCEKFGFEGTPPTFTSNNPPTQAEQDYILANHEKWVGYNPLTNGITNGKELDTYEQWPASTAISNSAESALYADLCISRKIPIKFFHGENDTVASIRWIEYYTQMLKNAGVYYEFRRYASEAHNAWNAGDDITFTTDLGVQMTVNGASYEGLLFLKRFDQ